MRPFEKLKVVLGVTGGVSAYKAADITSQLKKRGAQVHVIMTRAATRFITPLTLQAISQNDVITDDDMFGLYKTYMEHISVAEKADVFLIAPATANIIGKIASGLADDFLSTAAIAFTGPFVIALEMDSSMYNNPVCRSNIEKLKGMGYHFVEPERSEYERRGELAPVEDIIEKVHEIISPKDFKGRGVLVTASRTEEPIDVVRCVTNRSTGRMGYALARAAMRRGADVTLVSGPSHLLPPKGVNFISVRTAEEMKDAVLGAFDGADVVISAAAVADYRCEHVAAYKIRKSVDSELNLKMVLNPDILSILGAKKGKKFLVGFASETDDLITRAQDKLWRKNLDMIIACNISQEGSDFDYDVNIVKIIDAKGIIDEMPRMSNEILADEILDRIAASLSKR
ncbi:MAG: bifunctional phosphopantothenoylcysteine decarboxylase/phosphopantothenate--cysteine ligase CoaBC [bacterium]